MLDHRPNIISAIHRAVPKTIIIAQDNYLSCDAIAFGARSLADKAALLVLRSALNKPSRPRQDPSLAGFNVHNGGFL